MKNKIDTADKVLHKPSAEEWTVAYIDDVRDELVPVGWPFTIAKLSDCHLVEKATDTEKHALILEMSKMPDDPRKRYAIDALNNKEATNANK